MKEFATESIRNVCLAGQRGCGKTSLADAVAFNTKVNNRIGHVDDGTSLFDYREEELSRKATLSSKLLACEWNKIKLNLLDCPGHSEFIGELQACLDVTETVGIVINATAGVEIGTQLHWREVEKRGNSRFFFVNKIENENVEWKNVLNGIKEAFGKACVAVQIPIGQSESFRGLVDLLHMKAFEFDSEGNRKEVDIPGDMKQQAETEREALIEVAAESDDSLLERFFESGTLPDADVVKGLRAGIVNGTLFPVFFGSGQKNMGVKVLLDFIAEFLPAPGQRGPKKAHKAGDEKTPVELRSNPSAKTVSYVFKTISEGHLGEMSFVRCFDGAIVPGMELSNEARRMSERINVMHSLQGKNRIDVPKIIAGDIGLLVKLKGTHTGDTLAVSDAHVTVPPTDFMNPVMDVAMRPKHKGDEDKIANGLHKLHEEDPTFRLVQDPALKQQVLYAQGPTHIDVLTSALKKRFGVEVDLAKPRIPYRETIRGKAEKQYRHKKQSGGRGQFGDVYIRLEPNGRGQGFEFVDEIKGGVIPNKFIPAVEKGVIESMTHGALAGAQVVDVKVALYFGSYHDVDSSEMAFKIAGSMAFREGFLEANPILLEPIYNVEIVIPSEYAGDVMGDVSGRRGRISGMDPDSRNQIIRAQIPQAELYQYSVDLRSMSQGQGTYSLSFSHYEEVPHEVAQKVIEEAKREREEEQ